MKSIMSHKFSQIPDVQISRSTFDCSHGHKTTFDADYLYPVLVDEVLPGDTFKLSATMFARMATPIKPLMDNLFLDTFYFFVPNRLLWTHWNNFMGEKATPDDETEYLLPVMTAPAVTGHVVGSLSDYMGIPTGIASLEHSSLWHRAYNLIYNEWFRDQNLIDPVVVDLDDGPDSPTDYVLLKRGKRHDYFTSALPWPQKGPSVELPLGDSAPVLGIGKVNNTFSGTGAAPYLSNGTTESWGANTYANIGVASNDDKFVVQKKTGSAYPNIYADLSDATASTINALRQAFQIQRMYERDARGGSRYIEIVRSHFGVVSDDLRATRPVYLGGNSQHISINPIAQTSGTPVSGTPQGNLSAMGTVMSNNGFVKSFTEHGVILGLVSVRADLTYQQGLNRMFSRQTRFDFFWPTLSNIGEQAVLNKEIYAQGPATVDGSGNKIDDLPFGYQERYAEYRYKPSIITGKMRSTYATSLDIWHLSQEFGSLPELGEDFINENVPMSRVIAVNTEPAFIFDSYFKYIKTRPMPVYSVPGLIDHL